MSGIPSNFSTTHFTCDSYQSMDIDVSRKEESLEDFVKSAIDREDLDCLKTCIADLEDGVNTRLEYGCNLLTYAFDKRSVVCVEALLEMGARLEDHERELTPLFTAVDEGVLPMVRLFLKHGANITGEFDFNTETALSRAAWKFCVEFNSFLTDSVLATCTYEIKSTLIAMTDHWKQLRAFGNEYGTPWALFSEENPLSFARDFLIVCMNFVAEDHTLVNTEMAIRAGIFDLINEKVKIYQQKAPQEELLQPDQITGVKLVHRIVPVVRSSEQFQDLSNEQLQEYIDRLNLELRGGKTEADIDWSEYPRFSIAQFRGIHYYRNHFTRAQRCDHQATCHLNRIAPAPAAYLMSNLTPSNHQLARESEMRVNAATISDTFETLRESGPSTQYWGDKKRVFATPNDMVQQRMSNSYGPYMNDVANPKNPATQLLYDKGIRQGYPHYATSDLPMHALRYTFGKKPIKGLTEYRLRPDFQQTGIPLHPLPGKVFVTMFTPLQMHLHRTQHVAGMHNRRHIGLQSTVAPERETSIPGGVASEISVYEELVTIPSFEEYDASYQETYGMTQRQFDRYKKEILTGQELEQLEDRLIDKIIEHKELQLLEFAREEATRRGAYLIFRHFSGEYGVNFEQMRTPHKKEQSFSYTKKEQQLLV